MIALAMCYAVVISLPLAALGALLEHVGALGRRPRRWAWIAVLASAVVLTALTPWRALPAAPPSPITQNRDEDASRPQLKVEAPTAATLQSEWAPWGKWLDVQIAKGRRQIARADAWCRWLWPLGSAGVLLVYGFGRSALARRRRSWREAVVQSVPVLVSAEDGPAIVGVLNPRIVLPAWALELEPGAVRLMLRHEQQHQRARDPLLIHLAGIALVMMPWNPLIWWMLSRLRLAVELDCDARVLGIAPGYAPAPAAEVSIYGELLLAVVTRRSSRRQLIAPAMLEHPSTLTRRISAMYSDRARFITLRVAAAGVAAGLTLALTLIVPVPRLGAQSQETPGATTSNITGSATSPAFRMPARTEMKTLVSQYASEITRGQKPQTLVFVLDASGNVIGGQTMQVLELLLRLTRTSLEQEISPDIEARERRAREREAREKAEIREPERVEPRLASKNETQPEMSREDEARAKRAIAERDAAALASRLISIDLVRYSAGEVATGPVNVYFITTTGK